MSVSNDNGSGCFVGLQSYSEWGRCCRLPMSFIKIRARPSHAAVNQRRLPEGEIHIWTAPLSSNPKDQEHWFATLSPDERERAGRLKFDRDRSMFIAGRGQLRAILSAYTGAPARDLIFEYGRFGKPALRDHLGIYFNVSHSAEWAVYAIAREERLGADIERIRPIPEIENIARQFFGPAEYAEYLKLGSDQRENWFFRSWTRKEAYLKALGGGFSSPDDLPANPSSEWTLFDFQPETGYAAAIAVFGRNWQKPILQSDKLPLNTRH